MGRGGELQLVQEFVRQAAVRGGSFLVHGEPGTGKTGLLEAAAAAAAAAGIVVLGGAGLRDETDTNFSLLNLLLRPLRSYIPALAARHRTPLSMALGLGDVPAPAGLDVANAIVELLQIACVTRPLLMIVDDLHQVDQSSSAVLGFIARRLAGRAIGLLAASDRSPGAGHALDPCRARCHTQAWHRRGVAPGARGDAGQTWRRPPRPPRPACG